MSAPGTRPTHPRWFVVLVAAGIALVVAAVVLLLLSAVGVDQVDRGVFVLVVLVAAVAGGGLSRVLVPKLPPLGRRPE